MPCSVSCRCTAVTFFFFFFLTSSVDSRLGMFALFGSKSWCSFFYLPTYLVAPRFSCNQVNLLYSALRRTISFQRLLFSCCQSSLRSCCRLRSREITAPPGDVTNVVSLLPFSLTHVVSFAFSYTFTCELLVLNACTVSGGQLFQRPSCSWQRMVVRLTIVSRMSIVVVLLC